MWEEVNSQLYKKFVFKNFIDAFEFMGKVSAIAEKMNHHPKWTNVYNVLEIWLSTHDAGNVVTQKDIALAEAIDGIC